MSRTDYLQCRLLAADTGEYVPHEAIDFYTQAGLSEKQIKIILRGLAFLVPLSINSLMLIIE